MNNHPCGKRVWWLAVAAALLTATPGFALVTPEQGPSALARVEYLRSKTVDKTPEQLQAERDKVLEERNQKVLAGMGQPPVGFAPYDHAGIAMADGENVVVAGNGENSTGSIIQKNLIGLLLLGFAFFVAGLVLRKKQPPPDDNFKKFPRKFSA